MPMPMVRTIAVVRVAEGSPAAAAPNATPTARPSGTLWRVMDSISRVFRRQAVFIPHFPYQTEKPLAKSDMEVDFLAVGLDRRSSPNRIECKQKEAEEIGNGIG